MFKVDEIRYNFETPLMHILTVSTHWVTDEDNEHRDHGNKADEIRYNFGTAGVHIFTLKRATFCMK